MRYLYSFGLSHINSYLFICGSPCIVSMISEPPTAFLLSFKVSMMTIPSYVSLQDCRIRNKQKGKNEMLSKDMIAKLMDKKKGLHCNTFIRPQSKEFRLLIKEAFASKYSVSKNKLSIKAWITPQYKHVTRKVTIESGLSQEQDSKRHPLGQIPLMISCL